MRTLFGCLDDRLLRALDGSKTVRRYARGEALFYEGMPAFAIHVVGSGLIKLYKAGDRGDLVIRLAGPGQTLGLRPLLAGELYAATAAAVEPSAICAFPGDMVLDLAWRSRELAINLMAHLARELRVSEDLAILLTQRTAMQRTAHVILMLLSPSSEHAPIDLRVRLPLLHREMAQMAGTTPETFSRTLHALARRGVIQVSRAEVRIRDLDALKRIAR